ncbi:long-chain-fatty-acid-CoA ligase [Panus rudis PR-1116 ss-1]|nr:long-chain-fatty-acid-CoA ligase [Panus rudis PR-1116 ss-1]
MSLAMRSYRRTIEECDAILCAPDMPYEMESRLVDGLMQRVYKNLWPSLRDFWLQSASQYRDQVYIVYGSERHTYGAVLQRSLRAAAVFRDVYQIRKGDRVAICSRNLPEYLTAFWACQLLGAVAVLVNAWLPLEPLTHCLLHTGGKLILLDSERADRIAPAREKLTRNGAVGLIILDSHVLRSPRQGFDSWEDILKRSASTRDDNESFNYPHVGPEDNATVMFTSGTTGLPKGVLSTQRQFLTNLRNATVGAARAILRTGGALPTPPTGPQKGVLIAVPFFHVSGLTSLSMLATMSGFKIVLMRKWDVPEAVRLIKEENVRIAGGIPMIVSDLVESKLAGYPLDTLLFGGSPAHDQLPSKGKRAFPSAVFQAYGMTETNSIAVALAGIDYEERPTAVGLPCPVNDVLIVDSQGKVLPRGESGEVWLRGPDIMKCYWNDPEATRKAITQDGWLKTGDLGYLDHDNFLYIRDRLKDLIIRGGENIDSVSVENAVLADDRVREVAAVGVPDKRLGELVAVVVSPKPQYRHRVKEHEILQVARQRLPKFAVPVMVVIHKDMFELTPSGKIKKGPLRDLARLEWERRRHLNSSTGSRL